MFSFHQASASGEKKMKIARRRLPPSLIRH